MSDKEWVRPVYPVLLALAAGWEPRFPWERARVKEEATRVLEDRCRAITLERENEALQLEIEGLRYDLQRHD